jgi:hypothetical protein
VIINSVHVSLLPRMSLVVAHTCRARTWPPGQPVTRSGHGTRERVASAKNRNSVGPLGLFDRLVRDSEQRRRHIEAERLCGL